VEKKEIDRILDELQQHPAHQLLTLNKKRNTRNTVNGVFQVIENYWKVRVFQNHFLKTATITSPLLHSNK